MLLRFATGARLCSGWTVRETVARLTGELEAAAVPEPDTSASLIVAHLMNENNTEKLSTELASQGCLSIFNFLYQIFSLVSLCLMIGIIMFIRERHHCHHFLCR